jgi:hypothetical protein
MDCTRATRYEASVSQLRDLVRTTRPALSAWLQSPSPQHAFDVADSIVGEEELGTLVQAVLGLRPPQPAPLGWQLECLSTSDNGPLVYVVPDEATKRLADFPEASLSSAAEYVLDIEEADLPPQARSGPTTRPGRVSWWRDEVLSWVCPFAREAQSQGHSLFLIVSL